MRSLSSRARFGVCALFVIAACTDDAVTPAEDTPTLGGKAGAAGASAGRAGGPAAGSGGQAQAGKGGSPNAAGTGGAAGDGGKGGGSAGGPSAGAAGKGGAAGQAGTAGKGGKGGAGPVVPEGLCPVVFRSTQSGSLTVAGEWNAFAKDTATPLVKGADGTATATVNLAPGLQAYKLLVDGDYRIDPDQGRRKYVDGIENSAVLVHDCNKPSLAAEASAATAEGAFTATLGYTAAIHGPGAGLDASDVEGTLFHDGSTRPLTATELSVTEDGKVHLALAGLAKGKYTARIIPRAGGVAGEALRLPFWIEAKPFDWKDAVIYMIMTDRFRNGDPSNDGAKLGADPRGEFQGGDLQGVTAAIEDGSLDKLGVRALWLTPFQTNPDKAYLAADNFHKVTGYHGYWPLEPRKVDPRLGGDAALKAMVAAAHRHGIRILQDYVINHVHEDHAYVKEHPDWFRTGCVCGTDNCDWTSHALDCKFTPYLPDVNHTVPAANQAFVDDAVWWMDTFDLDGLRVDAVKHVEEIATRNVSAAVREAFDTANAKPFLMGETAMGWSDCDDPCNDENYGTISRYVGPQGLDGQFDFVLYHGVSVRTFAYGDKGMLHADYWTKHGLAKWPKDAIMTPYIGSHDTPRFASFADYRGQDASHDRNVPNNQWDNPAGAPSDEEPYARTRLGLAWMLALPGAPLLYYGDEYADWGGSDPNNRRMMRAEGELTTREKDTLAFVRKIGTARQNVEALRRGDYVSLVGTTEDTLVFGRSLPAGKSAVVGLTRGNTPQAISVDGASLGLSAGQTLTEQLTGTKVVVGAGGKVVITIPARSVAILAE